MFKIRLTALAIALLLACSSSSPPQQPPDAGPADTRGTISGKLTLFQGAGTTAALPDIFVDQRDSLAQALVSAIPPQFEYPRGSHVVPGEFIVRFTEANLSPEA